MSEQEYQDNQAYQYQRQVDLDAIRQDRVEQRLKQLFENPNELAVFIEKNADTFQGLMIEVITSEINDLDN